MRGSALVPIALFVIGGALVTGAVLTGRASAQLVLIIPVFSGSSIAFLLGVACLVAGFLTLPFAWIGPIDPAPAVEPSEEPGEAGPEFGGVVLIGPLPVV